MVIFLLAALAMAQSPVRSMQVDLSPCQALPESVGRLHSDPGWPISVEGPPGLSAEEQAFCDEPPLDPVERVRLGHQIVLDAKTSPQVAAQALLEAHRRAENPVRYRLETVGGAVVLVADGTRSSPSSPWNTFEPLLDTKITLPAQSSTSLKAVLEGVVAALVAKRDVAVTVGLGGLEGPLYEVGLDFAGAENVPARQVLERVLGESGARVSWRLQSYANAPKKWGIVLLPRELWVAPPGPPEREKRPLVMAPRGPWADFQVPPSGFLPVTPRPTYTDAEKVRFRCEMLAGSTDLLDEFVGAYVDSPAVLTDNSLSALVAILNRTEGYDAIRHGELTCPTVSRGDLPLWRSFLVAIREHPELEADGLPIADEALRLTVLELTSG